MKMYTVYFEIGGKKMKTTVEARHEIEAKEKVLKKVVFHKVKEDEEFSKDMKEAMDLLDKILFPKK